ncbi:PAS domain-containing sensor histidine kinase [Desulfovibrio inopinatus]|uniref:PAS domain-containing sensor histidine kinase n=1 Tax=Desulfovibrio inopinatus TaxID=102109 RepID=UPI00040BF652|nr:PAS domain-containing sensor histidine kinase [Desulfovibrio inopinatus]
MTKEKSNEGILASENAQLKQKIAILEHELCSMKMLCGTAVESGGDTQEMQTALKQSQELLQSVFCSIRDSLIVLDRHWRIVLTNFRGDASKEAPPDVVGAPCYIIFMGRERPCEECHVLTAFHTGQPVCVEKTSPITGQSFDIYAYPMFNDAGEVELVVEHAHNITAFKQQEDALRSALREKESLMREVTHRVKNNLQLVASLLQIQQGTMDNGRDSTTLAAAQSRIRSIALVHEELYQAKDLSQIGFRTYLEKLVPKSLAAHSLGRSIEYELDLEDIVLSIDQAVPLGLLVNELVTNAARHAFRGKATGRVYVSFVAEGDTLVLCVADSGNGMPEGMDIYTATTMGFILITNLAGQLRGQLSMDSGSSGTTFRLRLPRHETGTRFKFDHTERETNGT